MSFELGAVGAAWASSGPSMNDGPTLLSRYPRLHPRHPALRQLGDDLVRDLLIEAGLLLAIRARTLAIDAHALALRSAQTARLSPEAGWAANCDRAGPPPEAGGTRRAGTKWRTRCRGGPRRERRPPRATGKGQRRRLAAQRDGRRSPPLSSSRGTGDAPEIE